MDKEQIKKIVDSPIEYDESKEDTLRSWFRDCYSKRMRWVLIGIFVQYTVLAAVAVFCAVKFFRTDQTQYQIMHAAIIILCSEWIGFVSVYGWVMMQRPRNMREIHRLELRIAELIETLKSNSN